MDELADTQRCLQQTSDALALATARMEVHLRTLAALKGMRDRWVSAADKWRAPGAAVPASFLLKAACLDQCALELSQVIAEEAEMGSRL